MTALIFLAIKSLILAGAGLLILRLMRTRSAAERSWVAHLALLALVALPFAPLALPTFAVEAPVFVGEAERPATIDPATSTSATAATAAILAPAPATPDALPAISGTQLAAAAYWLPAAVLLGITLLAILRLLTLRARAEVLVDGHWLGALARAQKRMGFKHGTALLTSDDLPSPISWGLMRPVILLNTRAVDAADEAEAIIAHELAHVARFDWAKLLLARVATAMFWFNPLVWMLAREAHQLREEAADDSVLAADIADTDYAQLLVGIARHECRGLLIGAHGVAPGRGSLARRVARVLDSGSSRGPVARSFGLGVFVGAMALAAPLAAITLVPKGTNALALTSAGAPATAQARPGPANPSIELAEIISDSVSASVAGAVASVNGLSRDMTRDVQKEVEKAAERREKDVEKNLETALDQRWSGMGPRPGSVGPRPGTVGPRPGSVGPDGRDSTLDQALAMRAVGVTPEYLAEMRKVLPRFEKIDVDELIGLRAVGVTPQFVREMADAGYTHLDADDLMGARAVGVTGQYARSLAAAGYPRLDIDDLTSLRAVGVTAADISAARRDGFVNLDPDDLVKYKTIGLTPHHRERDDGPDPDD
ncbi:MAG TPA: M56 family metallopeptidase [Sphingomicrobium sp.]|jgi:beta-lactamase regulating signal transducer with metallopeptidase domain